MLFVLTGGNCKTRKGKYFSTGPRNGTAIDNWQDYIEDIAIFAFGCKDM